MKAPEIQIREVRSLNGINRKLRLAFKIGLPLGAGVLIFAAILGGFNSPQHPQHRSAARMSAIAEALMAMACIAMTLKFLLDAYVCVRGFSKSGRLRVSGSIGYASGAVILASAAMVLATMAIKDWSRP